MGRTPLAGILIMMLMGSPSLHGQDFYIEGQISAQMEYRGNKSMTGGILTGAFLGFAGWPLACLWSILQMWECRINI